MFRGEERKTDTPKTGTRLFESGTREGRAQAHVQCGWKMGGNKKETKKKEKMVSDSGEWGSFFKTRYQKKKSKDAAEVMQGSCPGVPEKGTYLDVVSFSVLVSIFSKRRGLTTKKRGGKGMAGFFLLFFLARFRNLCFGVSKSFFFYRCLIVFKE